MNKRRPARYQVLDKDANDIGVCQHFRVTHGGVLITYGSWFIGRLAWAPGTWTYIVPHED